MKQENDYNIIKAELKSEETTADKITIALWFTFDWLFSQIRAHAVVDLIPLMSLSIVEV